MSEPDTLPAFLMPFVAQLRRRRVQVGIADVHALRLALLAGFGLSSRNELRELCVHLWAKSPDEAEVVRAAFANLADAGLLADWSTADMSVPDPVRPDLPPEPVPDDDDPEDGSALPNAAATEAAASVQVGGVSYLGHDLDFDLGNLQTKAVDRGLVLVPQYPLTAREVAQAWRHLRRPVRSGPALELDVQATIGARARRAVSTPPVLAPRRRNAVRLQLLIDRQGSMAPFHGYVDYVIGAIRHAARIDNVHAVYFHDLPGSPADNNALDEMPNPFRPDLDEVLSLIEPLQHGRVYDEPTLTAPRSWAEVLAGITAMTAVLVVSDAGAARRQLDIARLADTIALVKALHMGSPTVAWLNPVPREQWARTTAGQVARHVPMFPFTRQGLYQAVDTLRGRPFAVERPV